MSVVLQYVNTALINSGKRGVLDKSSDGYYTVVFGGFNTDNAQGISYPMTEKVAELLNGSSYLQRNINAGTLYGEMGHPVWVPSQMQKNEYLRRLTKVDEKNRAFHIRKLYIDDGLLKNPDGSKIYTVIAEVKPLDNEYGSQLRGSLDNPSENVYFSIRAFATTGYVNGKMARLVQNIVTWDAVVDGGMRFACKYESPACEEFNETVFTETNFHDAINANMIDGVSMESIHSVLLNDIYNSITTKTSGMSLW